MVEQGIFYGTKDTDGVYTHVAVETLILGVNECPPEILANLIVLHGSTVLVEELSYKHSVCTIDFGSLTGLRVSDAREVTRAFAEQPEEVDVYRPKVEKQKNYHGYNCRNGFHVPWTSFV